MPHKDPEARQAYERQRYQANKDKIATYGREYRARNKDVIRLKKKSYNDTHEEERRVYFLNYNQQHNTRILARNRAYHQSHKEVINTKSREYKESRREELRQKSRDYYAANRLTINAKNRAYRTANLAISRQREHAYKAAHPEIKAVSNARRRARKAGVPLNDLTPQQWLEIQGAQDHRCAYCGRRYTNRLTQDHIQPLSSGGSHTLANVIGACSLCNSKKGTKGPLCPVQPLLFSLAPAKKKKVS